MAKLLDFLASGIPGAENGTAQFFVPGTTDPTQVFQDAAAEHDYPIGALNLLGLQGQLVVFATSRVRCVLTSSAGAVVFDAEVDVGNAGLIDVSSSAFVDVNGNPVVSLDDVLAMAAGSFGGLNWKYLITTGETPLNYRDVVTGIQVDVRAFGAVGDDATDNLDNFQRAIDYCASVGGGVVYIPGGIWRVRDVVVNPHNNVSIRGAGRDATVIKVMGSGQGMRVLGNYCTVGDLTLNASAGSNADFAITVGGQGSIIERLNVGTGSGNWIGGIDLGAATDLLIRKNVILHDAGIGLALTSRGGSGKIAIEDNTISSTGTGTASIDLQGGQQGIRIRDNVLVGSNYCVYVDAGFSGGKVLVRDNLLTPNTQGISFNLATNIGFEQTGNGRDYHTQTYTVDGSTNSSAPKWLEQGAFQYYALTGAANATLNLLRPTPNPGPFLGEAPERKVLRIHLHADAASGLTVGFSSDYRIDSATVSNLIPLSVSGANPRDIILTFAYSFEEAKWVECGPIV